MSAENRERFKRDEAAYLDEWAMTDDQKQAVLDRDMNRMIALGGNIYFLAKIGATDGKSFQQMAASMTGMSRGRVPRHDGRRRPLARRQPRTRAEWDEQTGVSARISASVYTSHVPAIGVAIDLGKTDEPYWQPAVRRLRAGRRRGSPPTRPTSIILVYNDHATAFSLDIIPTFAIGTAAELRGRRRGLGAAPGARRGRPPRAGVPHRPLGHPAGLRPHDRQPAWTSITG